MGVIMNKLKKKILIIPSIIALFSIGFLAYTTLNLNTVSKKSYVEFKKDLASNKIQSIEFNNSDAMVVTLNSGEIYSSTDPQSPDFQESLLEKGVVVKKEGTTSLKKTIPSLTLTGSIIFIVLYILNSKKITLGNSFSPDDVSDNMKVNYDFTKVAGNDEAKESLNDIVDFLKNPEKYAKYGARIPKGVILYGKPGTGKTLLAKAVAGESHVPFYAMSGSDFMQMYVGVGASRVRSVFKKAKAQGKALIFIDEIDAIGKKRDGSGSSSGSDERDQTLNALLTEMSGFGEKEGIVVIAATNRLDILDPALLRPGRFDRHIEVALPDINARERILSLHLENKPHNNINMKEVAEKTVYFSGAKLENLTNEAAILAAKDDKDTLTMEHINSAYDIVIAGHEKKHRSHINPSEKRITAYHEAGHALCSLLKTPENKVSKVTIIPTTKGAGGYTITIPKDSSYETISNLKNRIMVLLAGRAAEEIIFGEDNITTGAYGDLSSSTETIMAMLSEYGMGKNLGLLKMSSLGPLSSAYGNEVIGEAKELLESLYEDTKNLLKDNLDILHKISNMLLEKETIYNKDLLKAI